MATWTSKDPQAVKDYTYTIPLDAEDEIASATFEKLSGDAVIDNDPEGERVENVITAWLSGGTAGETNVFRVAWVTADGREDDDIITLAIIANEYDAPLSLTDYAKPQPAHLTARYPAFADVERTTIAYWLVDAERQVDTSWMEGDYATGLMALAAHNMTLNGLGTGAEAEAAAAGASGFKTIRSGALTLERFDTGSGASASAWSSTRYGSEFYALLRRNRAGPRVMPTGSLPTYPGHYVDGGV